MAKKHLNSMFPYTTPSKWKSHDQAHFTRRRDIKGWTYPFPSGSYLVFFLVMKIQNEVMFDLFLCLMLIVFENAKAKGTITQVQIGLSHKEVLVMLANIYCVQIKL